MTKAEIQTIKSLHSKAGRIEQGVFICEGAKLVDEVLHSSLRIKQLYTTYDRHGAKLISANDMSRISALKTATDTLALVEIPCYSAESPTGLKLVLDGVQDPGNLGTIIRIADWFGIHDIYCSLGSADCFNPKVVQATMGAISRVRIHYIKLTALLSATTEPIYGTFLEGDNIYKTELVEDGYVVMGSEGRGISDEISELVNAKLYIPPFNTSGATVESLNVAVATAIICSEFRRRISKE